MTELDRNNFKFDLRGDNDETFRVVMSSGELSIDDCSYEDIPNDPTYAMAREIARLRGLIKFATGA